MKFLALSLAIALGAEDGGIPSLDYVAVERAALTIKADGGEATLYVDGGSWLSDAYAIGYAKELADKRKRIEVLEANAGVPEARWLGLAAGLGAVAGVIATLVYFGVKDRK